MKKLYPYLTYAGVVPFITCAACLLFGIGQLPWLGSIENILRVYAMVICNFLAGAHWGQHLHIQGKWSRALLISSNTVAVTLWLTFLILSFKALMLVIVTTFVILLLIDHGLFKDHLITRHYFMTRCVVTVSVIFSLLISVMAS